MSAPRRTKLEMEAVYADVEEHMIRLRHDARVTSALVKKYQVHPHTVGKWTREVLARLRAKQAPTDHEDRRNLMRASLDTVASMALNKMVTLRDPTGKPMLDGNQAPIKVGAPDLKHALIAFAKLMELDGLAVPAQVVTTHAGGTTTHVVLGADERLAVEAALRGRG